MRGPDLEENIQLLAHDGEGGAALPLLQANVQGEHEAVQRGQQLHYLRPAIQSINYKQIGASMKESDFVTKRYNNISIILKLLRIGNILLSDPDPDWTITLYLLIKCILNQSRDMRYHINEICCFFAQNYVQTEIEKHRWHTNVLFIYPTQNGPDRLNCNLNHSVLLKSVIGMGLMTFAWLCNGCS
jgi:hypothetical protein